MNLNRKSFLQIGVSSVFGAVLTGALVALETQGYDVCVYGGTASGVCAAVSAAQRGCRVILVEPTRWLGGMTGGGLSHIDWGHKEAVGGMAASLLQDERTDAQYRAVFQRLVKENDITVVYECRLGRVHKEDARVQAISLDAAPPDQTGCPLALPTARNVRTILASVFIDCSYEGDLMAKAGVSYTWGRESTQEYLESLNGVTSNLAVYDIDPYVIPGKPASGLLPLLQDIQMGPQGSADRLTMGYGFRYKFSFEGGQLPLEAPENYDPQDFELFRRGFLNKVPMDLGRHMRKMGIYEPERGAVHKPGAGNLSRCLWTQTVFGSNAGYPDGDWVERERVWRFNQEFLRGLTHFMRSDSSVPEELRKKAQKVGFMPGPFDETGGWPHQLYVREARRMQSAYVLTQSDMEGKMAPSDSVGLASYGVDDWPYATYAHNGKVAINGGAFSMLYLGEKNRGIYQIPYRAIVPKKSECENLLVPVCCSASHIAMTSIRMEPVWMILGQSAGIAAALAVTQKQAVQDVDYASLQGQLLAAGQRLDLPERPEST